MPTLEFFLDFERDLNYIRNDFSKMRKLFNIDKLFKLYYPPLVKKNDEEVLDFFMNNKETILQQIEKISKQIEIKWKPLNDSFFKQVKNLTKFEWKNEKYLCHVSSSYICGGRYQRPNIIVFFPRTIHTNPLQTIPHELFHLHFWDFIESLGIELTNEKMTKLWDLSETIDFVLEDLKIKGFKYKSNLYPQHKKLYTKIKPLWKGNFKDFIKNSLKLHKI